MAEMVLRNVLYVRSYKVNLLSVDTAVSFGHRFIFHDSQARMVLNDAREINLKKDTGLFFLKVNYQNQVNPSTCNEDQTRCQRRYQFMAQTSWTPQQNRRKAHYWL